MSDDLVKQPIVWVETNEHLEEICDSWQAVDMLALDTEFMRSRTYYPIAGLIQINDGKQNYLVDPTRIDDFYPLVDILDDENIVKVLHSCSEDLEVFHYLFNSLPKNILDTQVAGAIVGCGFSVGYANLVRELLDVDLPKGETRSDWLQRPLSQSQLHYAAIDVEYLYQLANFLKAKLKACDRSEWAAQDSQSLVDNFFENQNPERSHLRFKSAWKLQPRQLVALKKLSRWREDLAQEKNVPRNRILKEAAIFAIAQQAPRQLNQLKKFEGMNERMVRSNGRKVLDLVEQAQSMEEENLPERLPSPLNAPERECLSQLKTAVSKIAQDLGVPNELLVKKKDYEHLLLARRAGKLEGEACMPSNFMGWRKDIVGEPLLTMVKAMS